MDPKVIAVECKSTIQKQSNVILYELNKDPAVNDRDFIIQRLSLVESINTSGITVRRLPSKLAGHPKPLKIMLNSHVDVSLIL